MRRTCHPPPGCGFEAPPARLQWVQVRSLLRRPASWRGDPAAARRTPAGRAQGTELAPRRPSPEALTVPWEMVRNPFFTEHFLFCHTFRILPEKG